MGIQRLCQNCFVQDGLAISFVEDAHEREHHKKNGANVVMIHQRT